MCCFYCELDFTIIIVHSHQSCCCCCCCSRQCFSRISTSTASSSFSFLLWNMYISVDFSLQINVNYLFGRNWFVAKLCYVTVSILTIADSISALIHKHRIWWWTEERRKGEQKKIDWNSANICPMPRKHKQIFP